MSTFRRNPSIILTVENQKRNGKQQLQDSEETAN